MERAGIKMPCDKTFKTTILPEVMEKVTNEINRKLNEAKTITLITDCWTNGQMTPFMGLAAMITDENLKKECFVLGIERMYGKHDAENIKKTIEIIMSNYKYETYKINGINFNLDIKTHCLIVEFLYLK
jgi:hypothetical protein